MPRSPRPRMESIPATYDYSMSIDANVPRLERKLETLADELRNARRANTDIILRVRRMLLEREKMRELERAAKKSKAAVEERGGVTVDPSIEKSSYPSAPLQDELASGGIEAPRPLRSLLDDNRVLLANAEEMSRETRERRARRRSSTLDSITSLLRGRAMHEMEMRRGEGGVANGVLQQRTEANPFEKIFKNVGTTTRARSVSLVTIPGAGPYNIKGETIRESVVDVVHATSTKTDEEEAIISEHLLPLSEPEHPRDDETMPAAVRHRKERNDHDVASVSDATTMEPSAVTEATIRGRESNDRNEVEAFTPPSMPSPSPTTLSFGKYFEIVVGGDVVSPVLDADEEQRDVGLLNNGEVSSKLDTALSDDERRNSDVECGHGDEDDNRLSTSDGSNSMDSTKNYKSLRRTTVRQERGVVRDILVPEAVVEKQVTKTLPSPPVDTVRVNDGTSSTDDKHWVGNEEARKGNAESSDPEPASVHRETHEIIGDNGVRNTGTISCPCTTDLQSFTGHVDSSSMCQTDTSAKDEDGVPRRLSLLVHDAMDVDAQCREDSAAITAKEINDVGSVGVTAEKKPCEEDLSRRDVGEAASVVDRRASSRELDVMRKGREQAFTEIAERNAVLEVENEIFKIEREICSATSGVTKKSVVDNGGSTSGITPIIDIDNAIQEEEDIFPGLHFSILE